MTENSYFIRDVASDMSLFSSLLSEKFEKIDDLKKKLKVFTDRMRSVSKMIPIKDVVKDKYCSVILNKFFETIDDYVSFYSNKKCKNVLVDSLNVFKEFLKIGNEQNDFLFRDTFLVVCAMPILKMVCVESPDKEWSKKYFLKTLVYYLRNQKKKNKALYSQMLMHNLVIKLIDQIYYSVDFPTQLKIVECLKLTVWKKDVMSKINELFPRNETLQEKFKEMMNSGITNRDFINIFNELNKHIKILSVPVENIIIGNKLISEEEDDFFIDFNWEGKTISIFADPFSFFDSPFSSSQDSAVNWKDTELVTISFKIVDSIENYIFRETNKNVYIINIALNDHPDYDLESSKEVMEKSRKIQLKTKPMKEAQSQILEKYLQKNFLNKYIFKIPTDDTKADYFNVNMHMSLSERCSVSPNPSLSFINKVKTCEQFFEKNNVNIIKPSYLEPVIEENSSLIDPNIEENQFSIFDQFSVHVVGSQNSQNSKRSDKNKSSPNTQKSNEIQINAISSNGISLPQETNHENIINESPETSVPNQNQGIETNNNVENSVPTSLVSVISNSCSETSMNNRIDQRLKMKTIPEINISLFDNPVNVHLENVQTPVVLNNEPDISCEIVSYSPGDSKKGNNKRNEQQDDAEGYESDRLFRTYNFKVDLRNILPERLRKNRVKNKLHDMENDSDDEVFIQTRTEKKRVKKLVISSESNEIKVEDPHISGSNVVLLVNSSDDENENNKNNMKKVDINGFTCQIDVNDAVLDKLKNKQVVVKLVKNLEEVKTVWKKTKRSNSLTNTSTMKQFDELQAHKGNTSRKRSKSVVRSSENIKKKSEERFHKQIKNITLNKRKIPISFDDIKITKRSTNTKRRLFNPNDECYDNFFQESNNTTLEKPNIDKALEEKPNVNKNADENQTKINIPPKRPRGRPRKNTSVTTKTDQLFDNLLTENVQIVTPVQTQRTKCKEIHKKIALTYESLFGPGDCTRTNTEEERSQISVSPLHSLSERNVGDFIKRNNESTLNDLSHSRIEILSISNKDISPIMNQTGFDKIVEHRRTSTPISSNEQNDDNGVQIYRSLFKQLKDKSCDLDKNNLLKYELDENNLLIALIYFKVYYKDNVSLGIPNSNSEGKFEKLKMYTKMLPLLNELISILSKNP